MEQPKVLIIGAGPTGLVLACELAWRGIALRIIDKNTGPSRHSKAVGVHARTLELLENHGVVEEMRRRGIAIQDMNLYIGGQRVVHLDLRVLDSAYTGVLSLPQSETERILLGRLNSLGVAVEWQTELVDLKPQNDSVCAVLRGNGAREETLTVPWLAGCDSTHSFVRQALKLPFEGERYREAFNLTDLVVDWELPRAQGHLFLADEGMFLMVPLPEEGLVRLVTNEPPGSADEERPDPTLEDCRQWLHHRVQHPAAKGAKLGHLLWSSRFRIQRRMVPMPRQGPVLLAGDAAHIHSPAGAQGMNNGIQDAINLGWKLALVIRGRAPQALLDTYSEERIPVARLTLRETHWLTWVVTLRNPLLRALRAQLAKRVINRATVKRRLVHTMAELEVHYRRSSLVASDGWPLLAMLRNWFASQSAPAAGDRAPDVVIIQPGNDGRLYDLLRHPGHTLLLFPKEAMDADLQRATAIREAVTARYAEEVQTLIFMTGKSKAQSQTTNAVLPDPQGAVYVRYQGASFPMYLLRPDRYIAFRHRTLAPEPLLRFLDTLAKKSSSPIPIRP